MVRVRLVESTINGSLKSDERFWKSLRVLSLCTVVPILNVGLVGVK